MQAHVRRRALALGTAALLVGIGFAVGGPTTPDAAALTFTPSITIDGNTAGPNDWDDLPPNLLDSDTTADACGSGVLDPDQLDGRLDALNVNNPSPTPGNVVNKGDFCRVWRAMEAVPDGGNLDVVLYGAWERYFANGEVTGYWPLLGPDATSQDDDFLIAFEYESSAVGTVEVLRWTGSTWVSAGPLSPDVFAVALDDPRGPLFGEFALNLSDAGLWPDSGDDQCAAYSSDYVFSRTGNSQNAELQDYVGLAPYPITPCGELEVIKRTIPSGTPGTFRYSVSRAGGGDVTPGQPTVGGTLTVPADPADLIAPALGGTDYTLAETSMPTGWQVKSLTCTFTDPTTGARRVVTSPTSPLPGVAVVPGATTICVIENGAPPTLTVIKQTIPESTDVQFPYEYSVNGGPATSFTLEDHSLPNGFPSQKIPVVAGNEVVISELEPLPAGWAFQSVTCVGDAESTYAGPVATVQVDQGEQIVCIFTNAQANLPPDKAYLVVRKVADAADGTVDFPFTVTGPSGEPQPPTPGSFTLSPPVTTAELVTVTPAVGGSQYTVTESVPTDWDLTSVTCLTTLPSGPATSTGTRGAGPSASVTLIPSQLAICTFTNAPEPPPPARLTVIKETNPQGDQTSFPFIRRGPELLPEVFTLADGAQEVLDPAPPGTYTVTELTPLGWAVTGSCLDAQGATVAVVDDGRATVDLEPGDDVTCTFTNTKRVSLTITKVAQPQSPQDFTFGVALNKVAPVTILLDDDGDPTDDPDNGQLPNSITGTELPPGLYTISETPVAGWTLTSLVCTGAPADTSRPGVALIRLSPGGSAACTYTNTKVVTPTPSPTATPSPSPTPTATPTSTPTPEPTPEPTEEPTLEPTDEASEEAAAGIADTGPGEGIDVALLGAAGLILAGGLLLSASRRRT